MELINLENSQVKAIFDVSLEEMKKALDSSFDMNVEKVTIKGFRKGKAPRSVFEKLYGVESLYEDALNVILNNKVKEINADEELAKKVCGQFIPEVEGDEKIDFTKPFKVSLTFDVYPVFDLPQYKGLEVKKAKTKSTKKDVDAAIYELIKKDAQKVLKEDQTIEEGDFATFDFVGSVDGEEFPGGKAENYELKIGSGQFIPGFEDQMIGMKANEVKDLNVKFPKKYQEKSLAGKEAVFKVTLHEVKVEQLPELTDEYVTSLKIEGVTTAALLKANQKEKIEAEKVVSEKNRQVDELINKILDNTVVQMPASLVANAVNSIRSQYENQAKMYNIPFETFLGLMNISKEKFDEDTQKSGARNALFNVVLEKILGEEKLFPTQEEIEAKAADDAAKTGKKKEELIRQNYVSYVNQLCYSKVTDFLLANAVEI